MEIPDSSIAMVSSLNDWRLDIVILFGKKNEVETLAPPLKATMYLRMQLSNGISMRIALKEYCLQETDNFSINVSKWYKNRLQGSPSCFKSKSFYQKQLISTIERGLEGEPVLDTMRQLEQEMIAVSSEDIQMHLEKLPLLMLIPLALLQFPGFLMLLVGPIFLQLFETFGGK